MISTTTLLMRNTYCILLLSAQKVDAPIPTSEDNGFLIRLFSPLTAGSVQSCDYNNIALSLIFGYQPA
jgi:hypothetical protein